MRNRFMALLGVATLWSTSLSSCQALDYQVRLENWEHLEKSDNLLHEMPSHHEKASRVGNLHGPADFFVRGNGDFLRFPDINYIWRNVAWFHLEKLVVSIVNYSKVCLS